MDNYDIPNDYMNFANGVRERLRGHVLDVDGNAAVFGLLGFLNQHGREFLDRVPLDVWVGQPDLDRSEAINNVMVDQLYDLINIINEIREEGNEVTSNEIRDRLVRRFGIRARGRKKHKKHTRRRRSRYRRTRHRRSRHKRSRHKKRKHKETKQRR